MAENSTFEEQWTLLRKETGMEDAPLRQKLEHFIFRQYGRVVLVHYVKALSALELSHHSTCGSAGGAVPWRNLFFTGPSLRKQPST